MKLTEQEIAEIVAAVEAVEYGRVIIEVHVRTRHLDVITESRARLRQQPVDVNKQRR